MPEANFLYVAYNKYICAVIKNIKNHLIYIIAQSSK